MTESEPYKSLGELTRRKERGWENKPLLNVLRRGFSL
jgi:hypothetical protein